MSSILDSIGQYYFQTAYVVPDIVAAEDWFGKMLGVPIWARSEVELGDTCQYRGQTSDSAMTIALGFAGEVQIELIQPVKGKSIYTEFQDQGRSGLHHIGCELLGQGSLSDGLVRFSYFDCNNNHSSVIEILDFSEAVMAGMDMMKQQCKELSAAKST
jgi:hypothetical protein